MKHFLVLLSILVTNMTFAEGSYLQVIVFNPVIKSLKSSAGSGSIRKGVSLVIRESQKSKRAFVLTPAHVVAGADKFQLENQGITPISKYLNMNPRLLGSSPTLDLAILETEFINDDFVKKNWVYLDFEMLKKRIQSSGIPKAGKIPVLNSGEVGLRTFLPWAKNKTWDFEIKTGNLSSPIFPINRWVEVYGSDLQPGQSGSPLTSTGTKEAMMIGIFTRALAGDRVGVGIPIDYIWEKFPQIAKGVDPFRKENPNSPYVDFEYTEQGGWLKFVVFPKGFGTNNKLRLTEVCRSKNYVDSSGGDWRDGDGPSNQFFMLFRLGQVFRPKDRCKGQMGLLTDGGKLIRGYKNKKGDTIELESLNDLSRIRSSAEEFAQFWKTKF